METEVALIYFFSGFFSALSTFRSKLIQYTDKVRFRIIGMPFTYAMLTSPAPTRNAHEELLHVAHEHSPFQFQLSEMKYLPNRWNVYLI